MEYKKQETPDSIMVTRPDNYYFAIKTGDIVYLSNKKFLLTRVQPTFDGQYLSSTWFNPQIEADNYKKDVWLAIVKIPKVTLAKSKKATLSQLKCAQGSSWKDLTCVVCCVKYNWECFYEDITDGSKFLRDKVNDGNAKMIQVSLPCLLHGDDNRINFTVAMSYEPKRDDVIYSSEHLFRDPDNEKESEVLMVTIQCPSFVITSE